MHEVSLLYVQLPDRRDCDADMLAAEKAFYAVHAAGSAHVDIQLGLLAAVNKELARLKAIIVIHPQAAWQQLDEMMKSFMHRVRAHTR